MSCVPPLRPLGTPIWIYLEVDGNKGLSTLYNSSVLYLTSEPPTDVGFWRHPHYHF